MIRYGLLFHYEHQLQQYGIWESVPSVLSSISINDCSDIHYFNPCIDSAQRAMTSDDTLHKLLKSLIFEKYSSIKPIASFSNEECTRLYNELTHRIEDICLSLTWDFDKGSFNEWLIQLIVEDISINIALELLKKVITSIN